MSVIKDMKNLIDLQQCKFKRSNLCYLPSLFDN